MHLRSILMLLLAALFTLCTMSMMPAQSAQPANPIPAGGTFDLQPGEKVTDANGRTVENKGRAGSGEVKITYTGSKSGSGQNIEVGTITLVRVPGSGGATNVDVNTGGNATTVDLDKDGTASSPSSTTVTGGNATITADGDNATFTVGGTGNNVTINGDNTHGTGAGATSGGTIHMGSGAEGSSFSSNGGNWTTV